jgi:Protein of unknwon function (DUF3310)
MEINEFPTIAQNSLNDQLASMPRSNEKLSCVDSCGGQTHASLKIGLNPQAHPAHYNKGKYEVIDVIEDWKLGFNLGNVVKYLARADHKGTPTADLYKSLFYLNREIASRERNA